MDGNWLGSWSGEWSGSGNPAPEGSISGAASFSISAIGNLTAADMPVPMASLGGFSPKIKPEEPQKELPEAVPEPIPESYVSRIRQEFLSESMAHDLITRARKRKSRAEEEALLLIL